MGKDTHAILIRPLATGRWEILEYATSAGSALAKANKRRDGFSYGDLILAIDIAEISAIQERGQCLYFVNKAKVVMEAPPPPNDTTWFLEWEGPDTEANRMLKMYGRVDRKLLAKTACAIARHALPYASTHDDAQRFALETTEAWTRGAASAMQVAIAGHVTAGPAACAAHIVAYSASDATVCNSASDAAYWTAIAMPGKFTDNIRRLSHIVREYIPLHVVLESLT